MGVKTPIFEKNGNDKIWDYRFVPIFLSICGHLFPTLWQCLGKIEFVKICQDPLKVDPPKIVFATWRLHL